MRTIRRISASISTHFDSIVSQLENHDALVDSAIKEMQRTAAKAQTQLNKVLQDGKKLKARQEGLCDKRAQWEERALRTHELDRNRALECVRRGKQVEREIDHVAEQLGAHQRLEDQLVKDLKTIKERIGELKRKKNALSARQFRAQALQAGQMDELGVLSELDDILDRWETKVATYEIESESYDAFECEFSAEEVGNDLEEELDSIVERASQS